MFPETGDKKELKQCVIDFCTHIPFVGHYYSGVWDNHTRIWHVFEIKEGRVRLNMPIMSFPTLQEVPENEWADWIDMGHIRWVETNYDAD
jgi:hypothetical protein